MGLSQVGSPLKDQKALSLSIILKGGFQKNSWKLQEAIDPFELKDTFQT